MHSFNLAATLNPMPVQEFLTDHLGRCFVRIPGYSEKFAELFDWRALNHVLRHCRMDPKQLRLFKDGKPVSYAASGEEDQRRWRHFAPDAITLAVRDGATLVLNFVDEVHEPITAFCYRLERELRTHVGVNLYASWSRERTRGFDLHWDDHDVLIIQIEGRKQWEIYGQTTRFPIDRGSEVLRPEGAPHWSGYLTRGDVIYIPRGWWHVAIPCDEPTLHLTVGLYNPTGVGLLKWLMGGLSDLESLRMDVPRFAGTEVRAQYQRMIQDTLIRAINHPNLLRAFERYWDVSDSPRPAFGFPWSAQLDRIPEDESAFVHLVPRHIELEPAPDSGRTNASFNSRSVTLDDDILQILSFLLAHAPVSIKTYYEGCRGYAERDALQRALSYLSELGLIVIQVDS